jgi:hypothetical protein
MYNYLVINKIDISESFVELKNFLRFNTALSPDFSILLELRKYDEKFNSIKIYHLLLVLEILENYKYPINFVSINKINNLAIEIVIPPYSPENSVHRIRKKSRLLKIIRQFTPRSQITNLEGQPLIRYLSKLHNLEQNSNSLKKVLIGIETNSSEINSNGHIVSKNIVTSRNKNDFLWKNKNLKVIIVAPTYHGASAGIRVLHKLSDKLNQFGFNVLTLIYDPTELDDEGSMKLTIEKEIYSDSIVIVPETITALPFKPKITIKYLLNFVGNLPTSSLGKFPIMPSIIICYSSLISKKFPRLFINVLPENSFDYHNNHKTIDLLLYFGKKYQFEKTSDLRLKITNKFATEYLEITREWPSSNLIPHLLLTSKNLISFDPLSALNHEASLFGCSVHIIFSESNMHLMEIFKNYELDNPLIHLYSDLSEVKLLETIDCSILTDVKNTLMNLSKEIEEHDLSRFVKLITATQN